MRDRTRINNQIRASEVRVIDAEGVNYGVMPLSEALKLAIGKGVDLIEISATATPPITKLMEYGKYQYLENKKQKAAKAKSSVTETKSLQVKIGTGDHDLELKAKKASEFLKVGHRVRITLYLRGRAKYLDQKFLKERVARILKLITEEYKIVEDIRSSPNGLSLTIEKAK